MVGGEFFAHLFVFFIVSFQYIIPALPNLFRALNRRYFRHFLIAPKWRPGSSQLVIDAEIQNTTYMFFINPLTHNSTTLTKTNRFRMMKRYDAPVSLIQTIPPPIKCKRGCRGIKQEDFVVRPRPFLLFHNINDIPEYIRDNYSIAIRRIHQIQI